MSKEKRKKGNQINNKIKNTKEGNCVEDKNKQQ